MDPLIWIVLPHQLFKPSVLLKKATTVYIVEDPYYLNPSFHVQKLCLHVASMHYYYEMIQKKYPNLKVQYIPFSSCSYASFRSMKNVHMYHPIDYKSMQHWKGKNITFHETPAFITPYNMCMKYKSQYGKNKRYTHLHFYKWQRKRLNLFIDTKENPWFGEWSFDKENRNPFGSNYQEPKYSSFMNDYIKKAILYVEKNFPKAFGDISTSTFYYPVTHLQAKRQLTSFLKNKLDQFGPSQDAIASNVVFGHHSILSSSINIGLLTPNDVITSVQNVCNGSKINKTIFASIEGFVRQIIGWREYMRFIYMFHHEELQHAFEHDIFSNTLPSSWFKGTTSLAILNTCIQKVKKYAYLHHIERLMVINNIATLCEVQPKEMYRWFMVCFIDSYDWVMLPNVRMNYNALDTDIRFMSRVYLSSENYIRKMSNFRNKEDDEQLHVLYSRFLRKYKYILKKDYIMAAQLKKIA